MALIVDYGSLKSTIVDFSKRTDLVDQVPTFIQIATNRISRDLRTRQQELTITGTISAGTSTFNLPADFVQMRRFLIVANNGNVDLDYVAPTFIERGTGRPKTYTISGSTIQLGSVPDADYPYSLTYYQKLAQFVADTDTNTLLTFAPSVYLYGALVEMGIYTMDEKMRQTWDAAYQRTVDDLNAADWGDGALMAVKPDMRIR